jgi:hypothetical protein
MPMESEESEDLTLVGVGMFPWQTLMMVSIF